MPFFKYSTARLSITEVLGTEVYAPLPLTAMCAPSIYDLCARSEAQIHGYYHTADRLVIIGLVGGLDCKNPCWEPYREVPGAFIHSFTHDSALCSQCRRGTPRRLSEFHFPGGAMIGRSTAAVDTAKIKGRTKGCGFILIVEPFLIPDPFLPPPKPTLPRSTPPPRSPPPHRLPRSRDAASSASSSASPSASHATASNASDHSASESADRRSSEAKAISLCADSAAFPGSHAHADLWAVPGFATRLGLAGGILCAGADTRLRGREPWNLGHYGKGFIAASLARIVLVQQDLDLNIGLTARSTLVLQPQSCASNFLVPRFSNLNILFSLRDACLTLCKLDYNSGVKMARFWTWLQRVTPGYRNPRTA
ncbi:hypothetical protein DFH09DRAFT_1083338 [Mycena vulgaris]|nr:hypothetical protein DFH09DRAFT_1083338 [Mycena vulgaris]